jgi:hypothetical protein
LATPSLASRSLPYVSAPSAIQGRRQIGTNAVVRGSTGGGGCHARPGAPTTVASSPHCSAVSCNDRTAKVNSGTPAASRAAASSRRFSSASTTTRSGRRATIAPTSGSLVPPTRGMRGCSQNLVQATGSIPQASNVSVADGTRETTLITSA